jgi:hypothetical protein
VIQRCSNADPAGPVFYTSLLAALVGFGLFFDHVAMIGTPVQVVAAQQSELARERASAEVEHVARWAVESRDHSGLPFIVVDKARARLFAFDTAGRLLASAPVLLGASRGDGPATEAATPAGRFVAASWLPGEGIVWINADAAVSLHGIPSGRSPGRSMQRLASAELEDRRISDGSLHVAGEFYSEYLRPLKEHSTIAYVLPEVLPVREVFEAPSAGAGFSFARFLRQQAPARRPS